MRTGKNVWRRTRRVAALQERGCGGHSPRVSFESHNPGTTFWHTSEVKENLQMLILTRRVSESVMIGEEVIITVLRVNGNQVRVGIDVPKSVAVHREEMYERIKRERRGNLTGQVDDRHHGMGIIVEYAEHRGKPQWTKPKPFRWDYTRFGRAEPVTASPDETIEMTIVKRNAALNGFNQGTLNGEAFSMETMRPKSTLREGRRYRLKVRNASDDIHPLHLHRHSFA